MSWNKWSLGLAICSGAIFSGVFIYWQYLRKQRKSKDEYMTALDNDDGDSPAHHIQAIDEIESSEDLSDLVETGNEFACVGDLYTSGEENGEEVGQSREPCEDDDDSTELKKESRKILILGLDQSGKSSLLSRLSKENRDCHEYKPTRGFNVVCVSFESIDLGLWEIGGGVDYRNYWKNFVLDVDLVLFVCDSGNRERISEAKQFLASILEDLDVEVDVHVVATKCDQPDSMTSDLMRANLGILQTDISVLRLAVKSAGAGVDMGIEELQNLCLNA